LRSGRDEEVILPGSEFTDDGRGEGLGAAAKKSRPNNEAESVDLVGFGEEAFCAGAVILAAGGSSSKRLKLDCC